MVWRMFKDLELVREQLDRALHPFHSRAFTRSDFDFPRINIYETPEEFVVVSEIPGANREKFDISMTAGNLTIRGEIRKIEEEGQLLRSERPAGAFGRVVQLSDKVDPKRVEAAYANGVLTVRVAKAEEAKPRQIEVKVA
jgi:HSP20 family protein